jgi:hypothetical protein
MRRLSWREDGPSAADILDADGTRLARYAWGPESNNPAFHPLCVRGGGPSLTNRAPWDHRWHHGLWWSWKLINGHLFWEDHPDYGGDALGLGRSVVREHTARELPDGRIRVEQAIEVRTPDAVLLDEARELVLHPDAGTGPEAWAIDWHLRSTAVEDCELRATPWPEVPWGGYAGLAYRPARSMAWGESFAADGDRRAADTLHGKTARWSALSGNLDGPVDSTPDTPAQAGVALLSHPGNVRHPTPVYAWSAGTGDFGFLAASPVFHEPLRLGAGDEIAFRFRVVVFPGAADPDMLDRAWSSYAAGGGERGAYAASRLGDMGS